MKWLGAIVPHWMRKPKKEPDPMLTIQEDIYVKQKAYSGTSVANTKR